MTTQSEHHAELERLTTKQLQSRVKKLAGKATKSNNRKSLIKRCVAATETPTVTTTAKPTHKTRRTLAVGTVLTRTHKVKDITVTVTDAGFEYDGATYKSLSTLAKSITGYHVSGPAFFKLAGK